MISNVQRRQGYHLLKIFGMNYQNELEVLEMSGTIFVLLRTFNQPISPCGTFHMMKLADKMF